MSVRSVAAGDDAGPTQVAVPRERDSRERRPTIVSPKAGSLHPHARADVGERTLAAAGLAGIAGLAPKADPLVVDLAPILARDNLEQVLLGFERLFGVRLGREHEPVRDAVDVRVHRNALHNAKAHVEHDVCGLAPHAGEFDELRHVGWHLAAVVGHDHLGARHGVLGLGFVKAERLDDLAHLGGGGASERLGSRPAAEELGRDLVNLRIGGLRREQHRDNEPEGIGVVEEALDGAVAGVQALADLNRALAPDVDAVVERTVSPTGFSMGWDVPPVISYISRAAGLTPNEACKTFNMGAGLMVICPADAEDAVVAELEAQGERPFRVGTCVAGSGKVVYSDER